MTVSHTGFYEPDGGYLKVEECVRQFQNRAHLNGAELKFDCQSLRWTHSGQDIQVECQGEIYRGKKLVLCLGAWTRKFLNENLPLAPKRTVQFWFQKGAVRGGPVFFQETVAGPWIYGFPPIGTTVKVAYHNVYGDCDPDRMERQIAQDEIDSIRALVSPLLPNLGEFAHAKTCLYTMTPDEHFCLGPLKSPNVILAAGFSGHGFKFAPVIGEIVEDFVSERLRPDLKLFDPYRF